MSADNNDKEIGLGSENVSGESVILNKYRKAIAMNKRREDAAQMLLLFPNEVFGHIFSYLDFDSLQSARQVSRSWNDNILPIMKKMCQCVFNVGHYQDCVDLIETLAKALVIPFENFTVSVTIRARFDKLKEIFVRLGCSLTELTIILDCCVTEEETTFGCTSDDLQFILLYCKKLKKLIFRAVKTAVEMEPFWKDDRLYLYCNSIEQISIFEISENQDNASDAQFSFSKLFLTNFAICMPNIREIFVSFVSQHQFHSFMKELVARRASGALKNLKILRLSVLEEQDEQQDVYFSKKYWQMLLDMDLKLESLHLENFTFSGSSEVLEQDIPPKLFERFFENNCEQLRECIIDTSWSSSVQRIKFPVFRNLSYLEVKLDDLIKHNDALEILFPKLKVLALDTDWEEQLDVSYPCVGGMLAYLWLTLVFPKKQKRVVKVRHCTVDYYFPNPDFFDAIFKWFPHTKKISAKVDIHFGFLNLLRGLGHTSLEEIYINVDCSLCKLDSHQMALQPKGDYEEVFRYHNVYNSVSIPPFQELRVLSIDISRCQSIDVLYLYNSDVMKLLTAAPKLEKLIVIERQGQTTREVVLKLNR